MSFFSVESKASLERVVWLCLNSSSNLERSCQIKRRHKPQESNFSSCHCEDFKFYLYLKQAYKKPCVFIHIYIYTCIKIVLLDIIILCIFK
jgi:hypothetical protein